MGAPAQHPAVAAIGAHHPARALVAAGAAPRRLAATLRGLQRLQEAEEYQHQRCEVDPDEERSIQAWVEVAMRERAPRVLP